MVWFGNLNIPLMVYWLPAMLLLNANCFIQDKHTQKGFIFDPGGLKQKGRFLKRISKFTDYTVEEKKVTHWRDEVNEMESYMHRVQ
jgi:hypothetical protein